MTPTDFNPEMYQLKKDKARITDLEAQLADRDKRLETAQNIIRIYGGPMLGAMVTQDRELYMKAIYGDKPCPEAKKDYFANCPGCEEKGKRMEAVREAYNDVEKEMDAMCYGDPGFPNMSKLDAVLSATPDKDFEYCSKCGYMTFNGANCSCATPDTGKVLAEGSDDEN